MSSGAEINCQRLWLAAAAAAVASNNQSVHVLSVQSNGLSHERDVGTNCKFISFQLRKCVVSFDSINKMCCWFIIIATAHDYDYDHDLIMILMKLNPLHSIILMQAVDVY